MTGDTTESVPYATFHDAEEARSEGERLIRDLTRFRDRLGASALHASARDVLHPVADELAQINARISDTIGNLEEKEQFGDEESYWNAFRYFCVDGNRGSVRTIAQVWEHLAKSFDMSSETYETLAETLLEWKEDIEHDARDKFGVTGTFQLIAGGYVFYEKPGSHKAQHATPIPKVVKPYTVSKHKEMPQSVAPEDHVTTSENENTEKMILTLLNQRHGHAKQSDIAKLLVASANMEYEEALRAIDRLASAGVIYKYKPARNRAAFLAIDHTLAASQEVSTSEEDSERSEEIDLALAREILAIITHQNKKPGQMTATSQMMEQISTSDLEDSKAITARHINAVARQLERLGLVATDTGSPLSGKQAKSRARSRKVFRVGFADSTTMQRARQLLSSGTLNEYLRTLQDESN